MPGKRLQQLQQFYTDDPHDPFNAYALAIELLNSDIDRSKAFFDLLLKEHPGYLPTYYHAAKLYSTLNEKETALQIFENGIALARKLNETKALRELQSAYQELTFE